MWVNIQVKCACACKRIETGMMMSRQKIQMKCMCAGELGRERREQESKWSTCVHGGELRQEWWEQGSEWHARVCASAAHKRVKMRLMWRWDKMSPCMQENWYDQNLIEGTIFDCLWVPAIVCNLCPRVLELGYLENKNLPVQWPCHHMTVQSAELPYISGNGWTYLSLISGQIIVILLEFFCRPAQRNLFAPAVGAQVTRNKWA